MARQLIFTSSPQGLEPGRSGYCTVARHKDLRSRLVRELERLSVYDFNQQGDGPKVEVSIFRKLALGSEEFFVVSRIRDAGLDYTNRTNYIAHHLILDSFEIATVPSPAEILSNWSGWLSKWEDPPRYFDESEEIDLSSCKTPELIPANGWLAATNDPGNAATLVSPAMKTPVVLEVHAGQEESLLKLFAESCALLTLSLDAWDYSFTTFLQENDDAKAFTWVGARGQPAAERLKQSAPNYLDLRDFAQSNVTDPIDDDLAHVARKGPKAKAAGAKSPKTRAKAPKAFSDREMAQFQQAASSYTASAAPTGSTVFPQEVVSSGKKRKKRPWLMQLAVISTALCLLVGLVVALAFGWDKFTKQRGNEPDPNGIVKAPPDVDDPPNPPAGEPVTEGAALMLGKPGVVVLREKHRFARWISLNVAGVSEPLRINLSNQEQDKYFDFLDSQEANASMQITLARNAEGALAIEALGEAPTGEPAGEPLTADISGADAVTLSADGSTATFVVPGQGRLSYEIPVDQLEVREQITALVAALRDNPAATAPLKFRVEGEGLDQRIVGIDSITIPGSGSIDPETPVRPESTGVPQVVTVGEPDAARILPDQRIVEIKVDGVNTLSYQFREDEEKQVRALVDFLAAGGKDLKLDVRVDGGRITFIDLGQVPAATIPIVPVGPDPAGPLGRTPVATYVIWLPGKQLPGKPINWRLDLPSSGSIRYEDDRFSSLLDSLLRAFDGVETARVWQANFSGPQSFYELAGNEEAFEPFAVEVVPDRVDPESLATFSLKTPGVSPHYSIEFLVKRGDFVNVDFATDMAKNAANHGFVLRIPRGSDQCVDLHFVSNMHFSGGKGYPPTPRGEQLALAHSLNPPFSTLRFQPTWPAGMNFKIITKGKQNSHALCLVPALGLGGEPRSDILFLSRMPTAHEFVYARQKNFPHAIVLPKQGGLLASEIHMKLDYFVTLERDLQRGIDAYQTQLLPMANLPDPKVYNYLFQFGSRATKGGADFTLGSSYGDYLINLTARFAQATFNQSTFEERQKLDAVKTKLFRDNLLSLSDPLNQKNLVSGWKSAETFLKKHAQIDLENFGYSADKGERDLQAIFRLVYFFFHVEMTFGANDPNLIRDLQLVRESIDGWESDQSLLGKLRKELRQRSESKAALPKDKEVYQKLTKFYRDYLDYQSKFKPPAKLDRNQYSKAIEFLNDAAKSKDFVSKIKVFQGYNQGLSKYMDTRERLRTARKTLIATPGGSQVQQARERLVGEKWALALFKVNAVAGSNAQPTLERVADLVTFSRTTRQ